MRRETIPPIELPTRTAGEPTTSRTKSATISALACTVAERAVPRVNPNPAMSTA